MKRRRLLAGLALAPLFTPVLARAAGALSADEIMTRNFFASKVKALEKSVTLTLLDAQGARRERKIHALSVLMPNGIDSRLLVRITAPADVRGVGFLKHEHMDGEDEQWIYLPALHKSRRLAANNKKDSFMGTDFAYGDILTPKVALYRNRLTGSETVEGVDCHVIESIPVDERVQREYDYGRKVQWIGKEHFHEVKIDYYDLSGRLLKTQLVKDIRLMDKAADRWAANVREMVNHQTGHRSTFVATSARAGVDIPERTFTLRHLEAE